jgi:hypothetical protein
MNHLNPLSPDSLQVITKEEKSEEFYQLKGEEISWTRVQDKNGATFRTDSNSHKYTFLGIYGEADALKFNVNFTDGGFKNTMIEDIYTAYNSTGLWVGSMAPSSYRTSVYPAIRLSVPITGGTGTLSGLTNLTLYSSFVDTNEAKTSDGSGACACWLADSYQSEPMSEATYQAGIGYANNPTEFGGGMYRSGIVYLFANEIYFSGNTGTTWDTGWSANTRYTYGGSPLATFKGDNRNKAVGLVHLDSGLITLFNPDIVSTFNSAVATGGTSTSGLTFSSTDCSGVIMDYDLTTRLNINTALLPQTFTKSTNASLLGARAAGIDCSDKVYITKVCYYGPTGQLVATGILDTPIEKNAEDYAMIQAQVTLDGGIKTSPDKDGRITYGPPSGI